MGLVNAWKGFFTSNQEVFEQKETKTSEVIVFNENEIELGFKHKKNVSWSSDD